jgi:MraZ protein
MGQEPTKAVLYAGTYPRSLDAKKRVAIPSAWVSGEGVEFHVVPHPLDGYLMVMGREELSSWKQIFQGLPMAPQERRAAIRKFYGEAHAVTTDKQGRILLPEKHCEKAGLAGDVVFVGSESRFEIWSKARYDATQPGDEDFYKRAAELSGL